MSKLVSHFILHNHSQLVYYKHNKNVVSGNLIKHCDHFVVNGEVTVYFTQTKDLV